ncbi:MAG: PKD domain-containing protein [Thermoplasmata archaeon]
MDSGCVWRKYCASLECDGCYNGSHFKAKVCGRFLQGRSSSGINPVIVSSIVTLALLSILCTFPEGSSQMATLEITTYDESGFPPPGSDGFYILAFVPINVTDTEGNFVTNGTTNETGFLSFDLPYGSYNLSYGGVNVSMRMGGVLYPGFRTMKKSTIVVLDNDTVVIDLHLTSIGFQWSQGGGGHGLELNYIDLNRSTPAKETVLTVPPGTRVETEFSFWELETPNVPIWYVSAYGSWNETSPLANIGSGMCSPSTHNLRTHQVDFFAPESEGTYEIRLVGVYDFTWPNSFWSSRHYSPSMGRDMGVDVISKGLEGPYGTATLRVEVPNHPPRAEAGPDVSTLEDGIVRFDGGSSYDDFGIVYFNWTFGDGGKQFGSNPEAQHSYGSSGVYIVRLNVSDEEGLWDVDYLTVYVNNLPPIADAGEDITTNQYEEVVFDSSASEDTPSDLERLTYIWYFGDGEVCAGKVVRHAYGESGNFTATLVVIDDDGATSSDTIEVNVIRAEVEKEAGGLDWFPILFIMLLILIVLAVIDLLYHMRKGPEAVERAEEPLPTEETEWEEN